MDVAHTAPISGDRLSGPDLSGPDLPGPDLSGPEELLWDESGIADLAPNATVLVINAAPVAARATEQGLDVWAFNDDAATLGPGSPRVGRACVPGEVIPTPDLMVMQLPHHLKALAEYTAWAHQLGTSRVAGVAKQRHLNRSMNTTLERWYQEVSASRGRAKARVLRASDPREQVYAQPWPRIQLEATTGLQVASHGGTFAGGRLDAGTALMVSAWPQVIADAPQGPMLAVDWGSGSGMLAALLARDLPAAQVHAVDISWAATAATAATAAANGLDVATHWADGVEWLAEQADHSIDLLVTNPAFHQGVAKESSATQDMIRQLGRVVSPGGQVWCVFNSHLPWRGEFARLVGRTDVARQNRSYTLVRWVAG